MTVKMNGLDYHKILQKEKEKEKVSHSKKENKVTLEYNSDNFW